MQQKCNKITKRLPGITFDTFIVTNKCFICYFSVTFRREGVFALCFRYLSGYDLYVSCKVGRLYENPWDMDDRCYNKLKHLGVTVSNKLCYKLLDLVVTVFVLL